MAKMRKQLYIACEEMNMVWDESEVLEFDVLWREGASVLELAKRFKRTTEEITLLALDRGSKGRIRKRPSGLVGSLGEKVAEPKKTATMSLGKGEVIERLDSIYEMSDQEVAANAEWIRFTCNKAYGLIKQFYRMQSRRKKDQQKKSSQVPG